MSRRAVPTWTTRADAPLSGREPDTRELFRAVSPAVQMVRTFSSVAAAEAGRVTVQRSAVAVCRFPDATTNCHALGSAPISPGSSGGGLFDGYGNLIGITTMTLKDAQSINLAIAADSFLR